MELTATRYYPSQTLSLKRVQYTYVNHKSIAGHLIYNRKTPPHNPFSSTSVIPILLLQTTIRKQFVQGTEISPISKLVCIFAHLGVFYIFLCNSNSKIQDTDVKRFCYHLLFLKFLCLGGNSYMLNKSLFEKRALLWAFKCSGKRQK